MSIIISALIINKWTCKACIGFSEWCFSSSAEICQSSQQSGADFVCNLMNSHPWAHKRVTKSKVNESMLPPELYKHQCYQKAVCFMVISQTYFPLLYLLSPSILTAFIFSHSPFQPFIILSVSRVCECVFIEGEGGWEPLINYSSLHIRETQWENHGKGKRKSLAFISSLDQITVMCRLHLTAI